MGYGTSEGSPRGNSGEWTHKVTGGPVGGRPEREGGYIKDIKSLFRQRRPFETLRGLAVDL